MRRENTVLVVDLPWETLHLKALVMDSEQCHCRSFHCVKKGEFLMMALWTVK